MSELQAAPNVGSQEDGAGGDGITAGQLLQEARQAAGLHIGALAVSLKVPVNKLEALESNQFDVLPDIVFVRALASSVCRTLKINAEPILERLPHTDRPRVTYRSTSVNTPFRSPGDGPGPTIWAHVSRPAVLSGIALLFSALLLSLLPAIDIGLDDFRLGAIEEVVSSFFSPEAVNKAQPDTVEVKVTPSIVEIPALVPSAPIVNPTATNPALSMATALIEAAPPASAPPTLPASSDTLVFSAKGESWVEVTDARGQVVLRRTLASGEVVGVSGALPLMAVVGRADAIQVQVRSKALDLNSLAKNNIARFEVK